MVDYVDEIEAIEKTITLSILSSSSNFPSCNLPSHLFRNSTQYLLCTHYSAKKYPRTIRATAAPKKNLAGAEFSEGPPLAADLRSEFQPPGTCCRWMFTAEFVILIPSWKIVS